MVFQGFTDDGGGGDDDDDDDDTFLPQSLYQPILYTGTTVDPQDVTQQPALAWLAKAEVN